MGGAIIERQSLIQPVIRPLSNHEASKVAKQLNQTRQVLTTNNPELTPNSTSSIIVQAIAELVEQVCQTLAIAHGQPKYLA